MSDDSYVSRESPKGSNYCDIKSSDLQKRSSSLQEKVRFDAGVISRKERDAIRLYLKEIEFSRLLTADEEKYYSRRAKKGDKSARNKMIESNLRLVVKISRRYMNRGLALLDLIEEGNLGLMHAVEKFDPEKGFRFSTYATWWIRQTIERSLMNQTRTIRLPIHIIKEINVYLRTGKKLQQKYGREATHEEIADVCERPVESVKRMFFLQARVTSVDVPASKDSDRLLIDLLPDSNSEDPQLNLQEITGEQRVAKWLDKLNEKQSHVLRSRFGIGDREIVTLEDLSVEFGVTRERVRQIQMVALQKLGRLIEADGYDRRSILESLNA